MLRIGAGEARRKGAYLAPRSRPSTGPGVHRVVYQALAKLNASGLTMVIVEQKAVPLPSSREKTIVLRQGRIVFKADRRPASEKLAELYLGERAA